MLVFVIPLKSQKVSNSWNLVSTLFERCVKSVCNQTSNDFRVIVVCNEKPSIDFSHPHLTYLEVDFPLPAANVEARDLDKGRKILTGLVYAGHFNPSHTMVVDADDCVSMRLAELVNQNPQCNGWFLSRGYVYQDGSKLIYLRRWGFEQRCGTCNIVRYDLNELPKSLEQEYPTLYKYYGNHKHVAKTMIKKGFPLEELPFEGAVYTVENGENIYHSSFKKLQSFNKSKNRSGILYRIRDLLDYRILNRQIRKEFGLYNIDDRLID